MREAPLYDPAVEAYMVCRSYGDGLPPRRLTLITGGAGGSEFYRSLSVSSCRADLPASSQLTDVTGLEGLE